MLRASGYSPPSSSLVLPKDYAAAPGSAPISHDEGSTILVAVLDRGTDEQAEYRTTVIAPDGSRLAPRR